MEKINILLVDDNQENLLAMEVLLENPEINLIKAVSGKEALACSLEHNITLVLLDVQMSKMGGIETAELMRAREATRSIPIIFVTSIKKERLYMFNGYSLGPVDYLFKPLDLEVLKSKVAVFIELEKNTREKLSSQERFHKLVEMNADGMIVVDKTGAIRFVNHAAESLLEHREDELIETLVRYSVKPGRKIEVDIPQKSGETITVEIRVMEIEWEGDDAYLASIHDITEMKQIDRMKSEFISVASHELRTPLTSIKNAVDILLRKKAGEINEAQEKFLGMAEKNINRLMALVNNLLDISKIESLGIDLNLTRQDICEIAANVVNSLKPLADAKSIEIEMNTSDYLPGIMVDALRIEQVLTNLVGNAIKFTQDKGTINVNVRKIGECSRDEPCFIEVSIIDNGIGIPEEQVEAVFDKFSQVESSLSKRDRSGTGLGLSICKGIIEAHRGGVCCRSTLGEGSCFVFTLPVHEEEISHVNCKNREKCKC